MCRFQMSPLFRIPLKFHHSPEIWSRLTLWRHASTIMAHPVVRQPAANDAHGGDTTRAELQTIKTKSLALSPSEDDAAIRRKYRPFILSDDTADDWISILELTSVLDMAENDLRNTNDRLKVLVLYGSLRRRSYSRLVAFEACRILFRLGCDVRVFDPEGLPVKNDTDHGHPKVQELRELSKWSDGHIWVTPEQHGNLVSCPFSLILSPPHTVIYLRLFLSSGDVRRQSSRIRLIGFL